jgi:hypothetical protein
LKRFVDGEYAWANTEAIMLAYTRDRSEIDSCLTPHLKTSAAKSPDAFRTEQIPAKDRRSQSSALYSRHERVFKYLQAVEALRPGSITIWHLWIPFDRQFELEYLNSQQP